MRVSGLAAAFYTSERWMRDKATEGVRGGCEGQNDRWTRHSGAMFSGWEPRLEGLNPPGKGKASILSSSPWRASAPPLTISVPAHIPPLFIALLHLSPLFPPFPSSPAPFSLTWVMTELPWHVLRRWTSRVFVHTANARARPMQDAHAEWIHSLRHAQPRVKEMAMERREKPAARLCARFFTASPGFSQHHVTM